MEKKYLFSALFFLIVLITSSLSAQQAHPVAKIRIGEDGSVEVLEKFEYGKEKGKNPFITWSLQPEKSFTQSSSRKDTVRSESLIPQDVTAAQTTMNPGPNLTYGGTCTNFSYAAPNLTINVCVGNSGSPGSGASMSTLGYYLSTDQTITSSDYLIGTDDVPFLPYLVQSSESITVDLTTVPGLPQGYYYVGFIIDLYNNVTEDNEADNYWLWTSPTIYFRYPDLVCMIIVKDHEGPQCMAYFGILNQSTAISSPFSYLFVLSLDTDIDPSEDIFIHETEWLWGLGSMEELHGDISFSTSGKPAGEYYMGMYVDSKFEINESLESNNSNYDDSPKIVIPPELDLPSTPILVSPSNGATDVSINPTLTWESGGGTVDNYYIELFNASHTRINNFYSTSTSSQIGPLDYSSSYSWKVKAKNAAGSSSFTAEWSFTTESETSTDVEQENDQPLPESFKLFQNYPNPFNPETTIHFALPRECFVTLTIYDFMGREVETLVNEHRNTGHYQERWNASGLTSGIYILQLKAGDYVETRKLIFQK